MIHSENVNKLLTSVKTPDDGYRALASAVVIQAADDYRRAKRENNKMRIQSIERFFRSALFDLFSHGANGEYIIRLLREEDPSTVGRGRGTYHLGRTPNET